MPAGAQSTVAPEMRTSSATLGSSAAKKAANSSGVPPTGSKPSCSNRSRVGPARRAAATSRAIRATAGAGVPAGANRPSQLLK